MTFPTDTTPEVLWEPPADVWETSRMGRFLRRLDGVHGIGGGGYEDFWAWSVDHLEEFWSAVWDEFGVVGDRAGGPVLADASMPAPDWFPRARVNWAENALRADIWDDGEVALVARSQTRGPEQVTFGQLRGRVARCAAGLRRLGVGEGDRVAAYVPNVPEAVVALLASASLGAVFSSCAPEFGTRSVVDRLGQIDPTVLIAADGYRYGDTAVDRTGELAAIRERLDSLEHTVLVPYLDGDASVPGAVTWDELLAEPAELTFRRVPFDHPLYVLYSSGTTGLPKPIIHGHGGITLEHCKALGLHSDLGSDDVFFWFSTTGWMMWNYLVSGLLVGATVVLFDGDPSHPDLGRLWRMAADTGVTYFGVSAPFLTACRRQGLSPGADLDLTALDGVGSTGSPLPPAGFRWVYEQVGEDLVLGSISGGTDVCTAFVGPAPLVPVRAGQIPCRMLGCAVHAYDPDGEPVIGRQGELVVTEPMPSMPVGFWGDPDHARYRDAYFADFPGVWTHGDWITITANGSCVITGRSDATLNRGGVRMGTSEFYTVVDADDAVGDSLVVHLEDDAGGPGRLLLFVAPPGHGTVDDLDQQVTGRLADRLADQLSPRHVPDDIVPVPAVPRTLSGKRCEIPVKRILSGTPPDRAVSRGALANPEAIDDIVAWAQRRTGPG